MECPSCQYAITPGMTIPLTVDAEDRHHCPYCLHRLSSVDEGDPGEISAERFTLRRKVREQFVDRLVKDGQPACPVCEHLLSESDQVLLRNTEHFQCSRCSHDLATEAYREEVYHEQRWLPVVFALGDLKADPNCANCCYLGVMAKSCQLAFSWMPNTSSKHCHLITSLLARSEWEDPRSDCLPACVAVTQYRKLAGAGLVLL